MNDKIKEFAGKALDKAVSYTWTQLDYDQIQELLACHAELIVRECAKRVDYWESRQGEHTEDLLKHFGVE
jgi:hypothetical protein